MNLFTTVNAAVTVPQAAAFSGLKIERGNMCRCLFHADNTPSMKLNETYYYCFGCQAHGDAVDLVAKALNLQPKEAAIRLVEAFHVDISGCVRKKEKTWHPFVPHKPDLSALAEKLAVLQKQSEEQSREQWLNDAQDTLLRYAGQLKEWKEKYAPASQDEEWALAVRRSLSEGSLGGIPAGPDLRPAGAGKLIRLLSGGNQTYP